MVDEISARLATLRKHLGERMGEKLTQETVAERSGLTEQQVNRLEAGLLGTTSSLICLLRFYNSHGYNLEWIQLEDNSRIPMMHASGEELQAIGETIIQIAQGMTSGYAKLNAQLRELGYSSLDEMTVVESDMPLAAGVLL